MAKLKGTQTEKNLVTAKKKHRKSGAVAIADTCMMAIRRRNYARHAPTPRPTSKYWENTGKQLV